MFSALAAYFFNIMFNYLLIFGKYGFPCIGLAGERISASIRIFLGFLFFVFATFLPYYRTRYKYYRKLGIGLHSIGQIVKI
jgi:Na+-driven multidrug efflux pump